MTTKSDAERIAALEVLVQIMRDEQRETNQKLDKLLALKHKGMGVFWLAATLFGTGIIGTVSMILEWIKGVH